MTDTRRCIMCNTKLAGYAPDEFVCGACLDNVPDAQEIDANLTRAYNDGHARGVSAASWMIDGNTTEETARRILAGIEDGDPMILDMLPGFIIGEYAGDSLPELFPWAPAEDRDELADHFLAGYDQGMEDELAERCREILEV